MKNITIIKPHKHFSFADIQELYKYRELLFTLVERDIKVRYKQTAIGSLWAIIQPFTTMILFSFFFGKIAKIPSDGIPYPVFSYAGLTLWTYFANSVNAASNSVVSNAGLISKVYFPRLIIPLVSTVIGIIDYAIATVILFFMMLFFHTPLTLNILFIPFIVFLTWVLATGLGFWFGATNVLFRDIKYVIGFVMQLWLYATPVIYPLSVAGQFKWIVTLNPMTGIIETHRFLLLGKPMIQPEILLFSTVASIAIFISGLLYFKSIERRFVDEI